MSLKKCNKKVIMSQEAKNKLQKGVKDKERSLIKYCKNKEICKFKTFKNNDHYFTIRGSLEKNLFLKITKDCDVHLFIKNDFFKNKDELKDFYKVQKWKDKIKGILEKAWDSQYIDNKTTKPSIDFAISKTDKNKDKRILSIIPILIYEEKYQYPKLNQAKTSVEWISAPIWDDIDQFNQSCIKHKKTRRQSIRKVVRIAKYLLKPRFQKLSTSVLEYYIYNRYFSNENNLPSDYLKVFIDFFKRIKKGDLEKYIDSNAKFKSFNYLDESNKQTWKSIKNYASNVNITDWNKLEQLILNP